MQNQTEHWVLHDDFPSLIASELCLTLQISLMNLANSSDPFQIG